MALRDPINVGLLNPKAYIQKNSWLPVSSHQIYEPSTVLFHPEGLFSEVIFGQVGSSERLYKRGYVDLRTKVFQPLIYRIIVSLKALYADVIAGKAYVYYDSTIQELVRCEMMDAGAGTGFTFFLKHFPNIKFKETDSLKRKDKLSILDKYKNNLMIDKYIVIPAGIRDIREENGRLSSEDINKLYLGLLSLSQAMPEQEEESSIFDSLRYNIQMRVVQVYEYIENLVTGKKGFAMGKFSARNVALANRNVITSPPISRVTSPNDPKYFKADETLVPLFQITKALTPAIVHSLRELFFSHVFDSDSVNYSLIDPKTFDLKYVQVKDEDRVLFTTTDGITKLINLFRNENIRHLPAAIKDSSGKFQYLYLVYDLQDTVYFLRNKEDFAEALMRRNTWGVGEGKVATDKSSWGIHNVKYLELLNTYGITKEEVIISGSGSLIAHGYPNSSGNNDLDLVVSNSTFNRLSNDSKFKIVDENGRNKLIDVTGNLEISDKHMAQWFKTDGIYKFKNRERTFESLKHTADNIGGYYFVDLEELNIKYHIVKTNKPENVKKIAWLESQMNNKYGKLKIKHLELLNDYDIPKNEAVISGSAALIAHGYPDGNNEDLDVTVSKETFNTLEKEFGFTPKPTSKGTPVLIDPTGKMEVMYFSPVAQLGFNQVKTNADEIDGYLFDSLSTLQTGYSLSPEERPKDKPKLRWLKYKVFNTQYLRPLTYMEMFYVAAYKSVNLTQPPKHVTATRYPILNVFGIIPTRVNIQTTEPNRTVHLRHASEPIDVVLPRYPILNAISQDSMSPHPSTLGGYGGDFDGDTMSMISVLSDEANQEIENFFQVPFSMINSNGQLNTGLSECKVGKYTFYSLTMSPPEVKNYI